MKYLLWVVICLLSSCANLKPVKYDCAWKLKQQYNDPFIDVVECRR